MPERENLHLLAPISTHQQEQEPKDVAEDEVEEGPEHKQPGWPLSHRAYAINRRSAALTRFPHPTGPAAIEPPSTTFDAAFGPRRLSRPTVGRAFLVTAGRGHADAAHFSQLPASPTEWLRKRTGKGPISRAGP
jgi:hypothetical protein